MMMNSKTRTNLFPPLKRSLHPKFPISWLLSYYTCRQRMKLNTAFEVRLRKVLISLIWTISNRDGVSSSEIIKTIDDENFIH